MSNKLARVAAFATAMTAAASSFAADIKPLGTPLEDALSRGALLALAAAGLVIGVAVIRRKQGR
ncbi:hypothetical protein [Scleromatobacter humisilvae]|uniref:Gram-positive cocci surface proteins LPxTG domain-containing protein n=1 Tax=Scleromatobacter humisilvae TaxID=2897159 RepID=A0A9X2BZ28_9BURK|nr:hypothetical protein [Scleromatobacter humisilvae]MCK9686223.1 hypothetical protein [Scleromatobacter humisilvae]